MFATLSWLIPAHAGKTRGYAYSSHGGPAHPRSRGENFPRRGEEDYRARLIPAHAGKTLLLGPIRNAPTAHPRSRGENWPVTVPLMTVTGSSPLTRGKLRHTARQSPPQRLIPAHAGKTSVFAGLRCH